MPWEYIQGFGGAILNLPGDCLFPIKYLRGFLSIVWWFNIQKLQEDINVGNYWSDAIEPLTTTEVVVKYHHSLQELEDCFLTGGHNLENERSFWIAAFRHLP